MGNFHQIGAEIVVAVGFPTLILKNFYYRISMLVTSQLTSMEKQFLTQPLCLV